MSALSKIEVICDMSKFAAIKKELSELKVGGMTFTQVLGCGVEKGTREYEVDENYEMELLPKIEVSVVVETDRVKRITDELLKHLHENGAEKTPGSISLKSFSHECLTWGRKARDPAGDDSYFLASP